MTEGEAPTQAAAVAEIKVSEVVETNDDESPQQQQHTNGETENGEEKPDPPKEMRAVVLTGFGGLKGVKILKKPEPSVQPGEVIIRVKAW